MAEGRPSRLRLITLALVVAAAVTGATGYVARASAERDRADRAAVAAAAGKSTLDTAAVGRVPHLVARSTVAGPEFGRVVLVPLSAPAGPRAVTGLTCERIAAVTSGGFCLSADRGVVTRYRGELLDGGLRPARTVTILGGASRARLSADGRLAASTVFVAGHSYLDVGFSTVTEVVHTDTGASSGNLEGFRIVKDGRIYHSADINLWGVTFAADDRTFYATLATAGRTYLVRGDLATREVTTLRENAECPSLSPDGRTIVYKRATRASTARKWRFTALDLGTGVETPLPETRSVDDQVAWLDGTHLLYGVPRPGGTGSDVWVSPLTGGPPRVLVPGAESPTVVRPAP